MSGCCPLKVAWQGLLMVGRSRVVGVGGKDLSVPGGGPGRVGWLQREAGGPRGPGGDGCPTRGQPPLASLPVRQEARPSP